MTFNDIMQWSCIGIIFLIVIVALVRKIVRAVRRYRHGDTPFQCNCGCHDCPSSRRCPKQADKK